VYFITVLACKVVLGLSILLWARFGDDAVECLLPVVLRVLIGLPVGALMCVAGVYCWKSLEAM
jgi:hypothetical protein